MPPERSWPARLGFLRSIRSRITAAFFVALLATGAAQAWLIAQQGPVADSLQLVTEGYLPLAKQVARLKQDQERVQRDLNRINNDKPRPVTGETSEAEIYTQELRDNLEVARVMATSMRGTARSDVAEKAVIAKTLAYLDSIERLFKQYEEQSRTYLQEAANGHVADAKEGQRRPLRATGKQLTTEFELLERTVDDRIASVTLATRQKQAAARGVAVTLSMLAAALGLAMLAASFVALRPIGRLTAEVARVAKGELGARVDLGGDDEVGTLALEFNAMAEAIELRDRRLTERQRELERVSRYLSSVVDSLDDGLVVVEGGVVTLTNPAGARVWAAEVGAPPPARLNDGLSPGSHTLSSPGGAVHAVRAVPFGESGVVAVVSDVTAQVRAQEQLARSERLALVGQMLAQITHEVRNPLNALSLAGELLGDELGDLDPGHKTEAWPLLDRISGEVERLTKVTGHYLQLARRPAPQPTSVDLARALTEITRLVKPELDEASVTLDVALEDVPPQLVDGGQVRQAVLNVLRNAREAGAHHVRLTLARTEDGVEIAVADDGSGMTEDQVSQATDPFWSTKASGTGLGLAITRQILEDHGGRIVIGPSATGGTLVTLSLPWRPSAPGDEEGPLDDLPIL